MQIQASKERGVLLAVVEGRLDTVHAAEFEKTLLGFIDAGERSLCVDCAGLTYLNSTALRGFLLVAKKMGACGGRFIVCGLCPNTSKVFEVIGFTKIITLVPTREEAVAMLGSEAAPA